MAKIIVTVSDKFGRFSYDLEMPDDVPCQKLLGDIVQTVSHYNNGIFFHPNRTKLTSEKLGRALRPEESLETAGIWTGDKLTIG
ncbi:MAG: EsaB/YukD family protein [Candidatus Fimenecus sp.]